MNSIEDLLCDRDAMLDDLHFNLLRAQQRMKHFADLKRRDDSFSVGDKV